MLQAGYTLAAMRSLLLSLGLFISLAASADGRPPNIVLIVADDLGYNDLGCYGAKSFKTPNIDQLAAEGLRLTSFYQAASTCSASRAAMLTGRYPDRNGVLEDFAPSSENGLTPEETTIAELLKTKGYATACFGKWHLGEKAEFLPKAQGFDTFFGMPYSHDTAPIINGTQVIEEDPDPRYLTKRYTQNALRFIRKNHDTPFFLYIAHSMPRAPLYVSEGFSGKANYGLYGDAVAEIDWSVGQILKSIDAEGLEKKTLVIFTSDHGPALDAGTHSGSADPLRGGRTTRHEGGHRVPCILWYPKKIKAHPPNDEIVSGLDLLPTFAHLAKAEPPPDIDGLDLWPWLSGKEKKSPRDTFFYSKWVVRKGPWKYFTPGKYEEFENGKPTERTYEKSRLYYLPQDPGELRSLEADYSDFVQQMADLCKKHQTDLEAPEETPPSPEPEEED